MTTTSALYDDRFFAEELESSGRAARKIVPAVLDLVSINSVLDIGCGVGMFLHIFAENGVKDIQGVDGDYLPRRYRQLPADKFLPHDLEKPLDLKRRFDMAMTLEVAEHLSDESADGFVDMLCAHSDLILFSAALPEQGGTNHINEQWPVYWEEKFACKGYACIDVLRPRLWSDKEIDMWYRQNIMFYANVAGLAKQPKLAAACAVESVDTRLRNLVHPDMFTKRSREVNDLLNLVRNLRHEIEVLKENQFKKLA